MEGVRQEKKEEDMNGNGGHAVKRATEQSAQSICWLKYLYAELQLDQNEDLK